MKKIVGLGVSKVFFWFSILHCLGLSFLKSGSKTEWQCHHASQLTFTLGCSIVQCLNYYNSQSRFSTGYLLGTGSGLIWKCTLIPHKYNTKGVVLQRGEFFKSGKALIFSPSAICAKNSQNVARMWTKPFRLFEPARLRIFIYFLIYWAILSLKSAAVLKACITV